MREIKFRIFMNGKFRYWGFHNDGHGMHFTGVPSSTSDHRTFEELQRDTEQYNGLKDEKGVEIYEGDILRGENGRKGSKQYFYMEVLYINAGWKIYLLTKPPGSTSEIGDIATFMELRMAATYEVVGNIYENAELLEANDE